MSPKRQKILETWRETLQRLADRLPDDPIPPPVDDGDGDDAHKGESIPELSTAPIPPRG